MPLLHRDKHVLTVLALQVCTRKARRCSDAIKRKTVFYIKPIWLHTEIANTFSESGVLTVYIETHVQRYE